MSRVVDIANEYQVGTSLFPASRTATANGTGVDFRDCSPVVTSILSSGALAGGGASVAVKLQESKNDNTADAHGAADAYSDITGATHTTTTSASSDNSTEAVTIFNRAERYVRAVATQSGSATAQLQCVILMAPKTSY